MNKINECLSLSTYTCKKNNVSKVVNIILSELFKELNY